MKAAMSFNQMGPQIINYIFQKYLLTECIKDSLICHIDNFIMELKNWESTR